MGDDAVITGATKILGVIGYPIEHSLSPVMHNAVLQQLGANYTYVPLLVPPVDLAGVLASLKSIDCRGFNVTIPHKQTVMAHLAEISDVARSIGAVNTVWPTEQGWAGTNTDILGFLSPLYSLPRPETVVILGGGGAARAVIAGCLQLGCTDIWVVGRDLGKLAALRTSWPQVKLQEWSKLNDLLPLADLVVNCTPIGMYPQLETSPLSMQQIDLLRVGAIVYDLIYTPRPTKLLQMAEAGGCQSIDGLDMLVGQGAAALELWLGQLEPMAFSASGAIELMRASLIEVLDKKD
jgi:shikimate dehydrogenase